MEYKIGPGIDGRSLVEREQMGLAWCRAVCWEWDEEYWGPAPKGFEKWPNGPRTIWQDFLYMNCKFRCKLWVLEPKWRHLERQLTEEERERYWRKYVLHGKSDEQLQEEIRQQLEEGRKEREAKPANMGALQKMWRWLTGRGRR